MRMFKDISVASRYTSSKIVKNSYVTTVINYILEPTSFEYQSNVVKYITKHISLYDIFKYFGISTPNLCSFKTNSFDNVYELYRASWLVHDEQKFKYNIEMGIM